MTVAVICEHLCLGIGIYVNVVVVVVVFVVVVVVTHGLTQLHRAGQRTTTGVFRKLGRVLTRLDCLRVPREHELALANSCQAAS